MSQGDGQPDLPGASHPSHTARESEHCLHLLGAATSALAVPATNAAARVSIRACCLTSVRRMFFDTRSPDSAPTVCFRRAAPSRSSIRFCKPARCSGEGVSGMGARPRKERDPPHLSAPPPSCPPPYNPLLATPSLRPPPVDPLLSTHLRRQCFHVKPLEKREEARLHRHVRFAVELGTLLAARRAVQHEVAAHGALGLAWEARLGEGWG